MKRGDKIPVAVSKRIAQEWGYDQVIVLGINPGQTYESSVSTYGVTKHDCEVAGKMGKQIAEWAVGNYKSLDDVCLNLKEKLNAIAGGKFEFKP